MIGSKIASHNRGHRRIAAAALALTKEPEDTEKIIPEEKTHFWDDAKRILGKDKNFNWFLVARFLSQFATMGFSFYIIYALRRFDMTPIVAGYLTADRKSVV